MTMKNNFGETQVPVVERRVSPELIRLLMVLNPHLRTFGSTLLVHITECITGGYMQIDAEIDERDWLVLRSGIARALKAYELFGSPSIKYITYERHPDVPEAGMTLSSKVCLTAEEFKTLVGQLTQLAGLTEEFAIRFFFEPAHVIGKFESVD